MLNKIKKSIKREYFVLLILLGLLPIVVLGILLNLYFTKILENELSRSMQQTLEKASVNAGSFIGRMADLSYVLSQSGELIKNIDDINNKQLYSNRDQKENIERLLLNSSYTLNFPVHIYVLDRHMNIYGNMSLTQNESNKIIGYITRNYKFNIYSRFDNRIHWIGIENNLIKGYDSNKLCYLARNIFYNGDYYGTIYIGVSDYIISRMFNRINVSDDSVILIYDQNMKNMFVIPENHRYISSLDNNELQRVASIKEGVSYLNYNNTNCIATCHINGMNWKIVMLTPVSGIKQKFIDIRIVTVGVTMISILFIMFFLFLINKNIVNPIVYLSTLMSVARKGNLQIRSNLTQENEIGILSEGFNKMMADFNKMIEKIQSDEILKKELEFKALQAQIKPHFLYNTLNSIRWMAEMNNETKVADAVVSLVRMLEYNTKSNEKLVLVREEIAYIKEYVNLQSLRYWNRFIVTFDIEDCILDFQMLKLTLQPIIENSIIHGLNSKKGKVSIRIKGEKKEDKLMFIIEDDGDGMDISTVASLKEKLKRRDSITDGKSIGVNNVNNRITMEYGDDDYGIDIHSVKNEGTIVCVSLPVILKG